MSNHVIFDMKFASHCSGMISVYRYGIICNNTKKRFYMDETYEYDEDHGFTNPKHEFSFCPHCGDPLVDLKIKVIGGQRIDA